MSNLILIFVSAFAFQLTELKGDYWLPVFILGAVFGMAAKRI